MVVRIVAVLLLVLGAAGCGGDDVTGHQASESAKADAPTEPATTVDESDVQNGTADDADLELEELDDSGVSGTATIEPNDDGRISIDITLDDGDDATHGVEVRLGSCADALDQGPGEALLDEATSYTLADIEDGTMHDDAKLPDKLLDEGTYTLLVHAGADLDGDVAACADVKVD